MTKVPIVATHEIIFEMHVVTTTLGTTATYQIPILVTSQDFDEQAFKAGNKGALFRKRTSFDDYIFPASSSTTPGDATGAASFATL